MNRKNIMILIFFILSASFFSSSLAVFFLESYYSKINFKILSQINSQIIKEYPEAENKIFSALKSYKDNPVTEEENILAAYGYKPQDFTKPVLKYNNIFIFASLPATAVLYLSALLIWHKKEIHNIRKLSSSLVKANNGGSFSVQEGEGEFFKLQDEIYKTVTMLYQTKEEALKTRNNFAENLSNIAHQIKTQVTSISLTLQKIKDNSKSCNSCPVLTGIEEKVLQLFNLEEKLLLLSRIDTGIIPFNKKETDVFTVLMLASDNLYELLLKADVTIDIPEAGEMLIYADMEWTMEAFINIFKNCMEHTPAGGTVYCSYTQNPVYTQIKIWDNGTGFAKEDMPHIFEKFYQGKNSLNGGTGIGLFLAKSIIESQNGTINASNLPEGGACFEVRFYSH